MVRRVTYRQAVREIAADHHGYVTTRQGRQAGIPQVEMAKLAAREALENIAYGVYRLPDWPAGPLDQAAEALARAGEGAYLHGQTVLALHGLAGANSRQVHVAVPRRTRARFPAFMVVTQTRPPARLDYVEGLACQPVADAITECLGHVELSRLHQAADDALGRDLITSSEYRHLNEEALS